MTGEKFFSDVKNGVILPCYLFEGEEEYSKESALGLLRKNLLPPPFGDMNETVLVNPDADALISTAETLPLMADKRLVVVRDCAHLTAGGGKSDKDGDSISAYVSRVPGSTCLVFFARGKANGTRKLYKALKKLDAVVSFDRLNDGALIKWVARELQGYGKKISVTAAEQLIFTVGRDLLNLKNETAKAAACAGESDVVDEGVIESVCTKTAEYKVFDLSDAVAEGDAAKAITLIENLIKDGESRLMLLALLERQYRQLLFARVLSSAGQAQAVAAQLGVPPFVASKLTRTAKRFSVGALRRAYRLCVDTEYRVKSGQLAEEGSVEGVVLRLMAMERKTDDD